MAEPELAGFGKNADLNSFPETIFFSVEHGCIQKFCNKFAGRPFSCLLRLFLPYLTIFTLDSLRHSAYGPVIVVGSLLFHQNHVSVSQVSSG